MSVSNDIAAPEKESTSSTSPSSSLSPTLNPSSKISSIFNFFSGKISIHIAIEILLYGITVYYFHKKIKELSNTVSNLEKKINDYDKIIEEQKQLVKKMSEININQQSL